MVQGDTKSTPSPGAGGGGLPLVLVLLVLAGISVGVYLVFFRQKPCLPLEECQTKRAELAQQMTQVLGVTAINPLPESTGDCVADTDRCRAEVAAWARQLETHRINVGCTPYFQCMSERKKAHQTLGHYVKDLIPLSDLPQTGNCSRRLVQ